VLLKVADMRLLGTCLATLVFIAACADSDSTGESDDAVNAPKIVVMRGVDRAGVLSTHEAKILKNDHGVKWTGVYIGGACNGGFGWTKAKVEDIAAATGWKFMPIWVGQQASALCGHHNLTTAQGTADGRAAAAKMKTFGWATDRNIPIALDVEAGTYFDHVTASTHYVRAWVNAVHAAGYRAYVYGSPFGLNHYKDAGVRIDAAWAASYFYHGFKAGLAPASLDQMGARFRHKNRAWQYAGNFAVSGTGKVDADTSNLLLAPKPGGTNRVIARDVPADCGVIAPGEGLVAGEVIASCDGARSLAFDHGDLVLTVNGQRAWSAGTDGVGATAVLEANGELVVYDADSEPVFTSDTGGFSDASLEVGDTLALVDGDQTIWTAAKGMLVPEPFDDDPTAAIEPAE
jgi:Rv2525c-like, glycoside hydrolase-like domain